MRTERKHRRSLRSSGHTLSSRFLYDDPSQYLKQRIVELTEQEKAQTREVLVRFAQSECIASNEQKSFNCGYLFLQALYHELKIDQICRKISARTNLFTMAFTV